MHSSRMSTAHSLPYGGGGLCQGGALSGGLCPGMGGLCPGMGGLCPVMGGLCHGMSLSRGVSVWEIPSL